MTKLAMRHNLKKENRLLIKRRKIKRLQTKIFARLRANAILVKLL
jgi:hypothetical protein